jgi:putative hemolysin
VRPIGPLLGPDGPSGLVIDRHETVTGMHMQALDRPSLEDLAASVGLLDDPRRISYVDPAAAAWRRHLTQGLQQLTGQRKLERLYDQWRQGVDTPAEGVAAAIGGLRVDLRYEPGQLAAVPTSGPLVVVANHPFGLLDGLAICHLLHRVRLDVKLMAYHLLYRVPEIRALTLPVGELTSPGGRALTLRTGEVAGEHLRAGGALVAFPAGGVSIAPYILGRPHDIPWKPFIAKMVQRHRATVLPVYVDGRNSAWFQVASQFSATLRVALLVHELRRRIGSAVRIRIGDPIPFADLVAIRDRTALTRHLRERTYALAGRRSPNERLKRLEAVLFRQN